MKLAQLYFAAAALFGISSGAVSAETDMKTLFNDFKETHNRVYASDFEENVRFVHFTKSLEEVERLRALNPKASFGVNHLSDRSPAELKALRGSLPTKNLTKVQMEMPKIGAVASAIDWRTQGVVSAVKNQEQCGSCWAFSATEEIESGWAMQGNQVPDLSPQQIVSCDTSSNGCNGGLTEYAYNYIQQAGGIESAEDYPYTSGQGNSGYCQADSSFFVQGITLSGYNSVGQGDENQMMQYMNSVGPISICIDASSWSYYTGGVLTSCGNQVDHCVQAVGYNSAAETPYWIVRNSWSTSWGIEGYIHLEMGQDMCAITHDPTTVSFGY